MLIPIITVLGETGGVRLAEIAGAGMIGCRLSDIVDSAPQELAETVRIPEIIDDNFREAFSTPAGIAVTQS